MIYQSKQRTSKCSRESRRAVTLVEAILVIIVLSIAAATGLVAFDPGFMARQAVVMETKNLGETLRGIRNTAMLHKTRIRIRRVRARDGDQIEVHELAGPMRDERHSVIPIDSGLRASGTSGWVAFRPDGTLSRRLQLSVYQSTVRGEVAVSPVTGTITTDLPTRS